MDILLEFVAVRDGHPWHGLKNASPEIRPSPSCMRPASRSGRIGFARRYGRGILRILDESVP